MDRFKKIVIEQKLERLRNQGRFVDPLLEQEISKYSFDDFMVSSSRAEFRVDGVLHSVDDEPAVVYVNDDQKLSMEMIFGKVGWQDIVEYGEIGLTKEWYKNGVLHRDNGPAMLQFEDRESDIEEEDFLYIFTETWYVEGVIHRDNGPAIVSYYENGSLESEAWYQSGFQYREDGPSIILYYSSGVAAVERWTKNYELCRTDGPAVIEYYENGLVEKETWYNNGEIDRENGLPAVVSYYKNKRLKQERWYKDGGKSYERTYYSDGKLKSEKAWGAEDAYYDTDEDEGSSGDEGSDEDE